MRDLVILLSTVLTSLPLLAHEIPIDVTVQAFLKPDGDRLSVLLRVPLEAMRDIEFATRGPGYLELSRIEPQLEEAAELWLLNDLLIFEDGLVLGRGELEAVRVVLPGDGSFEDYDTARQAVFSERLPGDTNLYWRQALLDVAVSYPIRSDRSEFAVEAGFARLGITTLTTIRYLPPVGSRKYISFTGDPGRLSLDPGAWEVLGRFLLTGFEHVLDGMDHLLFVFVLVIPLTGFRPLLVVVTAFTLAHSLTLAASMFELVPSGLWFPPLVELLIAASIVWMALENLLKSSFSRRWLIAFGFGLVHGFGFSFALRDTLQLAGDHVFAALAGFNLGIELAQLLLLAVLIAFLRLLLRWLPVKGLTVVLSVLVAHTAWHWLTERWEVLSLHSIVLPDLDLALLIGAMRWGMLFLGAAFVIWLLRGPFERWSRLR